MSETATPPAPAATTPTTLSQGPIANFELSLEDAWNQIVSLGPDGKYSMILLSFILTVFVLVFYGVAAGAPLAASTFICAAMLMN